MTAGLTFRIKNPAPKFKVFRKSFVLFIRNEMPTSAAAISYFTMLLLFPLFIVLLSASQSLFGNNTVKQQLIKTMLALLPGTGEFVRQNVDAAIRNLTREITISSTIIVVWASSWIFSIIERALNRIYGTCGRHFLHGRLVTLGLSLLLGAVLIANAWVSAFVALIRAKAQELPVNAPQFFYTLSGYAWQLTFIVVSLLVTITIFTLIYRLLPNASVKIIEALPGAIVAGLLWESAKYAFAWVLPYFHYNLFYGPIGLAVALLTWIYISSIIMLFGAQLTALLHVEHLYCDMLQSTTSSGHLEAKPESAPPAVVDGSIGS